MHGEALGIKEAESEYLNEINEVELP